MIIETARIITTGVIPRLKGAAKTVIPAVIPTVAAETVTVDAAEIAAETSTETAAADTMTAAAVAEATSTAVSSIINLKTRTNPVRVFVFMGVAYGANQRATEGGRPYIIPRYVLWVFCAAGS